ncbi:hypothetical protein HYR69_07830 [Candidatus Sumerlaeota bacterium]|nr:hypothetical protein [Candidatus Sumerlaeota bacterium]MBI3735964.1 hypothetical protein [Candidatus Sumerlaeota bacterium]
MDQLLDQNGRKFERRGNSGLVLVRASQKNGDAMTPWSDDLFVRLPSACQFVRVLDLKGMPHAMSPVISRTIRLQLGKDNESVSIYLDWEGSVARRYSCEGTDPAVICMDSNDAVLNTVRGGWTKESADLIVGLYP